MKKYTAPDLNIEVFSTQDIIATSITWCDEKEEYLIGASSDWWS